MTVPSTQSTSPYFTAFATDPKLHALPGIIDLPPANTTAAAGSSNVTTSTVTPSPPATLHLIVSTDTLEDCYDDCYALDACLYMTWGKRDGDCKGYGFMDAGNLTAVGVPVVEAADLVPDDGSLNATVTGTPGGIPGLPKETNVAGMGSSGGVGRRRGDGGGIAAVVGVAMGGLATALLALA
ncbi:hypothetical protein HKX48_006297 [Thoreauomyces humboldtii]|nr:hypothetical protein HKX48_006297 [Thoreauomyces humboldtii]